MAAKITLITPPDIYQNDLESILFCDLTEEEQEGVISWLKEVNNLEINIYYYQGEPNVSWLLHALSCTHYRYINVNNMSGITNHLVGYLLSKSNVFYSCDDVNIIQVYNHINHNKVRDATDFLEKVFNNGKI